MILRHHLSLSLASPPLIYLEMVLPQKLWLPHVLPFRKVIGNPNALEVLDTFLQLLLGSHLLLVRFPFRSLSLPHSKGSHTEHVSLAAHLRLLQHVNRPFRHRPVQRLNVGVPAHGPADHGSLRGTGLWLGLGAGRGEVVVGCAALSLALAFVALAAAVTVRGRPPRRSAYKTMQKGLSVGSDHMQFAENHRKQSLRRQFPTVIDRNSWSEQANADKCLHSSFGVHTSIFQLFKKGHSCKNMRGIGFDI